MSTASNGRNSGGPGAFLHRRRPQSWTAPVPDDWPVPVEVVFEHACPFRDEAERLRATTDALQGRVQELELELEALRRRLFGKKSEKIPPLDRELRKGRPVDRAAAQHKRAEHAAQKT